MALDLPGGLFVQGDVRETPASEVGSINAGTGINIIDAVISTDIATTSTKGIASFNSSDFAVSSGAVSLKSKTSYASFAPSGLNPENETVNFHINLNGYYYPDTDNTDHFMPIQLPNGAVLSNVILYGSGVHSWHLRYTAIAGGTPVALASQDPNVGQNISHTVNNSAYRYDIRLVSWDDAEYVEGVKITYTTDYT